jgi:hypothetical protein
MNYTASQGQIDQLNATLNSALSQVAAITGQPVQPPVEQPPAGGTIPPSGTNPAPPGVQVGTEWFDWDRPNQMITSQYPQGVVLAIPFNVPAGFTGTVHHELVANKGTDFDIKIWISMWTPGGDPIPGTVYEGSLISGVMPAGEDFHAQPGNYYFNGLVKNKSCELGAQQRHTP